jgi:hypothetical protein
MPRPQYVIDARLKEWATETQASHIDAINQHQSMRGAAKALGVTKSTVTQSMAALRKKAALFGYSPEHDMTRTVPDPFIVKGVSTYYNKEGKASGQWVKSTLDEAKGQRGHQSGDCCAS